MRVSTALTCAVRFDLAASSADNWKSQQFKSLVTFGDSYTDESRLQYFEDYDGAPPPPTWVEPANNDTASGGYTWARYVANSTQINLYDYAVRGAVCSNDLTPRRLNSINGYYPSVLGYEVPAFLPSSQARNSDNQSFLDIPPSATIYSIWIGTNDLGIDAFLTDSQVAGKIIPDYVDCVFSVLDNVYKNGGRFFIVQNVSPLHLTPLYATPERGGVDGSQYPSEAENVTETSYRMWEAVNYCPQHLQIQDSF